MSTSPKIQVADTAAVIPVMVQYYPKLVSTQLFASGDVFRYIQLNMTVRANLACREPH